MKHTALVVHDDPRVLASAASKLEAQGHSVRRASSLSEARRVLDAGLPDLVCTSLRLGDLPREFAIDRLRADFPGLRVLLLIAQDELSEAGTALAACDEYVAVPAEEGRFQKSVANLLERARLDREISQVAHAPRGAAPGTEHSAIGSTLLEPGQIRPFQQYERDILLHALNTTNWNVKETATRLKIGRATLYRKIDRYNLRAFRHQRQAS